MSLKSLLSPFAAREPAPADRLTSSCVAAEFDFSNPGMASSLLLELATELYDHPCCAA